MAMELTKKKNQNEKAKRALNPCFNFFGSKSKYVFSLYFKK
jgi:hypothetical protein